MFIKKYIILFGFLPLVLLGKSIIKEDLIKDDLNKEFNQLRQKKEYIYQYLNDSGIKSIDFENGFLKIRFHNNEVFCENKNIITDNCNVMLDKQAVINNVYSTDYVKKILSLFFKDKIMDEQNFGSKKLFYLINPFSPEYQTLLKKKKDVLRKLSIVYVIPKDKTYLEVNKLLNTSLNQKELRQIQNIYNSYKFDLPTTVILNRKK